MDNPRKLIATPKSGGVCGMASADSGQRQNRTGQGLQGFGKLVFVSFYQLMTAQRGGVGGVGAWGSVTTSGRGGLHHFAVAV